MSASLGFGRAVNVDLRLPIENREVLDIESEALYSLDVSLFECGAVDIARATSLSMSALNRRPRGKQIETHRYTQN